MLYGSDLIINTGKLLGVNMLWFVLLICALLLVLYKWYSRPRDAPPGPRGFPLLGIMPYMKKYPERMFAEWSKTYGPVMSVPMGTDNWVILNDFDSIHEALVKNGSVFSGRPSIPILNEITKGHGLALLDYGDFWKTQRKFGLMTLRGFGLGKRSMEDRILEEAEYLNEEIRKQHGKPFVITTKLSNTVSNVICSVVFGHRFPHDDPCFTKLLEVLNKWFGNSEENSKFTTLMFLPQLRFIPPFSNLMTALTKDLDFLFDLINKEIEAHEKDFQSDDIRDFIDAFLVEMKKGKDTFTNLQLIQYVRDLFEAGTETTTSTLRWSILCLIHYPQIQKKLFEEIENKLGQAGRPTMEMKADMPFCSAFIDEVTRYRTLVTLSVFHKVTEDVTFKGYRIPKGTTVAPNIWAVHNDPKLWDEPNKFKPERHLDCDGNYVKSNHVIPFSMGPRYCLGEQLAKMELFLFLVSMVQKFEFQADPDAETLPDIEDGSNGTVFVPFPYEVIAKEREA